MHSFRHLFGDAGLDPVPWLPAIEFLAKTSKTVRKFAEEENIDEIVIVSGDEPSHSEQAMVGWIDHERSRICQLSLTGPTYVDDGDVDSDSESLDFLPGQRFIACSAPPCLCCTLSISCGSGASGIPAVPILHNHQLDSKPVQNFEMQIDAEMNTAKKALENYRQRIRAANLVTDSKPAGFEEELRNVEQRKTAHAIFDDIFWRRRLKHRNMNVDGGGYDFRPKFRELWRTKVLQ